MQVENIRDGRQVTIRPAVGTDADQLRAFLTRLSAQSAYNRFFTGLGRIPDRVLALLLRRGGDQDVLLAVHGDEVIAHAMYTALPGRNGVADVAVVVADGWQRHGLGRLLARQLLAEAPAHGIREIGFTILADNQPAVRFVMRLWPQARPRTGGGVHEYRLPLSQGVAA